MCSYSNNKKKIHIFYTLTCCSCCKCLVTLGDAFALLLVGAGVSIADAMPVNTGCFDAAKGVGLQFAKFIEPVLNFGSLTTAQGLNALLQRKTGLAPAAMQEMVFQGLPFRQFSYSFKMTPRNREEAREVKRILDTFTCHMLKLNV